MDDQDIVLARTSLEASKRFEKEASLFNPALEVESSLVVLLKNRIAKVQEDQEFEQQIRDAILDRLPEAQFSELMALLHSVQSQSSVAVEKILSPFIPKVGERVPLLDASKEKDQASMDEKVFEKASKKALDALNELGKLSRVLNTLGDSEISKKE